MATEFKPTYHTDYSDGIKIKSVVAKDKEHNFFHLEIASVTAKDKENNYHILEVTEVIDQGDRFCIIAMKPDMGTLEEYENFDYDKEAETLANEDAHDFKYLRQTEKAIQVTKIGAPVFEAFWLPKSQIEVLDEAYDKLEEGKTISVLVPDWLEEKHGLE